MATRSKARRAPKPSAKAPKPRPRRLRKTAPPEPPTARPPSTSSAPPAAPVVSGEGFGIRFAARFLDGLYMTALGFFSGLLGGTALAIFQILGWVQPGWEENLKGFDWALLPAGFLATLLYHWSAEWIGGVTVGKWICRLRVVQQDGRPCGFKGAMIRNLAYYIDSLFFGLVGYNSMSKSRLQQRYGDLWGKTVVVKASNMPEGAKISGLHLFLAVAIGSAFNMLCMVVALVLRSL